MNWNTRLPIFNVITSLIDCSGRRNECHDQCENKRIFFWEKAVKPKQKDEHLAVVFIFGQKQLLRSKNEKKKMKWVVMGLRRL